jgi:hypothetical protein
MHTKTLFFSLISIAFVGCVGKKTPEDLCAHEHEIMLAEAKKGTKVSDDVDACKREMTAMQEKAPVTYKCMSSCVPSAHDMGAFIACEFKCGKEGRDAGEKLEEVEAAGSDMPAYDPSKNDVTIEFGDTKMKVKDAFAVPAYDDAKEGWWTLYVSDAFEPDGCLMHGGTKSKRSVDIDFKKRKGRVDLEGFHSMQFSQHDGGNHTSSWGCNKVDHGWVETIVPPSPGEDGRVRVHCAESQGHSIDGEIVFHTCDAKS